VFITTLLNPKAHIFAFVLLPPVTSSAAAPWLAALSVMIAVAGSDWILLGAFLARSSGSLAPRLVLQATVILVIFAGSLAGSIAAAF
jgi:threonine/homoserine/homoserine lactone efflux protein